jgi:hypothetical protein
MRERAEEAQTRNRYSLVYITNNSSVSNEGYAAEQRPRVNSRTSPPYGRTGRARQKGQQSMSSKRPQTFAKRDREQATRERREEKQKKKYAAAVARKAAAEGREPPAQD